jgi:DNA-binding NarL/FixJ family response regulator
MLAPGETHRCSGGWSSDVAIVAGCLDDISLHTLTQACHRDAGLRILDHVEHNMLGRAVETYEPQLVVVTVDAKHELLTSLRAAYPTLGLLVLVESHSPLLGTLLLALDVASAPCAARVQDLLASIHLAARGVPTWLAPGRRRLTSRGEQPDWLTPREIEVQQHLSRGSSYAVIARDLGISVNTVKTHAVSGRRKLAGACAPDDSSSLCPGPVDK